MRERCLNAQKCKGIQKIISSFTFVGFNSVQQLAEPATWSHYILAKHLTQTFDEYLSSQSELLTWLWMKYETVTLLLMQITFDFGLYQTLTFARKAKAQIHKCL